MEVEGGWMLWLQQVYDGRQQSWRRRDGEDVKREVICNREEQKKRQEQARLNQSVNQLEHIYY